MTALPLQDGTDDRPAFAAPAPLQRLFRQAGLAPPPASIRALRLDSDLGERGQRKILLAFTIDRADAVWFAASSPALRGITPSPSTDRSGPVLAVLGRARGEACEPAGAAVADEPDFPWWRPGPLDAQRRYAYCTADFDFVEVMINEHDGRVHLRAIN
ncbi:MAG: hypothetical protein SYC29_14705 [Planctomycetota bacterium]|nr:hypothetical protein [Planctomycetota bacterium]